MTEGLSIAETKYKVSTATNSIDFAKADDVGILGKF